jgi:hypothetical protein
VVRFAQHVCIPNECRWGELSSHPRPPATIAVRSMQAQLRAPVEEGGAETAAARRPCVGQRLRLQRPVLGASFFACVLRNERAGCAGGSLLAACYLQLAASCSRVRDMVRPPHDLGTFPGQDPYLGGLPGCCYNERHDSCDVCYTRQARDCAQVALSCAAKYARQQDSGLGFSPTFMARRGSCTYNATWVSCSPPSQPLTACISLGSRAQGAGIRVPVAMTPRPRLPLAPASIAT